MTVTEKRSQKTREQQRDMQSTGIVFSEKQFKVPFFSYQLSEKVEYGKIRILLGEEIDGKFKRACVAEFIAMLFFVIMCCGCAMATLAIPNPNLMMVLEFIFYFYVMFFKHYNY